MSDTIEMPLRARLDALTAKTASYLDSLGVHLYQCATLSGHPNLTLANFTECNFPGYASSSVTFGAAFINGSNNAESDSNIVTFTCNGTPSGGTQSVYGWYTDFGGVLGPYAAFGSPTPENITGANQSISIFIPFEEGDIL